MTRMTRRHFVGGVATAVLSTPAAACELGEYPLFSVTPGVADTCVQHSSEVLALLELADGEPEPLRQDLEATPIATPAPEPVEPTTVQQETVSKPKQPEISAQAPDTSLPPEARPKGFATVVATARAKLKARSKTKPQGVTVARAPKPAAPAIRTQPTKGVRYVHATSRFDGKTHRVPYYADDQYIDDNNSDINRLLCDWRTGETIDMKRDVLDFQWNLYQKLGTGEPWFIISGYRSPQTNAMLRAKSNGGVAKSSLHTHGMALDLRLKSRTPVQIFHAAWALGMGGTSPYSGSNFAHIDCGRRRTWGEGARYT